MARRWLLGLWSAIVVSIAAGCGAGAASPTAEPTRPPPAPPTAVAVRPTAVATAAPPTAAFCPPGVAPAFVFGLAELKQQLGDQMGDPIECEHPDPASGDNVQLTSRGLAYYRQSTNTPTFFNGIDRWALTAGGVVHWMGDSLDPPG